METLCEDSGLAYSTSKEAEAACVEDEACKGILEMGDGTFAIR